MLKVWWAVLRRFAASAQIDGTYMFCKQESVLQAARFLSKVDGLSLQVSLPYLLSSCTFCAALQYVNEKDGPCHSSDDRDIPT